VLLDPTSVPAEWCLNPSNGLSRNVTDDRQTDVTVNVQEDSLALQEAIPPNNNNNMMLSC